MAAKKKIDPKPAQTKPVVSKPVTKAKPVQASVPLTDTFKAGFWMENWLPALILTALAFALYAISIQYGYLLDDEMVIQKNAFVQKGFAGLSDIFKSDSFFGYFQDKQKLFLLEGGRYRPLSLATFAMEIGFFGKDNPNLVHFSHLINILLYALNGVLLYRILLGLFPVQPGGRWFFSVAFIASAIFMVHPLHTECVANIKGRDELLALAGGLTALYATLKYFDTRKFWWPIVAGVSLLLGLLAKENALTFLAIIPLTTWFFLRLPLPRILTSTIPLALAALIFIIIRYKALGFMIDHGKAMNDIMNNPFVDMTFGEKYATIFLTLGWYIKLLFIPHPLTHDYYPYHIPKIGWADWRALVPFVFYMAMGVWAVLNIRKRSVPAYAILFWFITLSIVSNLFVSVGSFMNERFAYMPSIGFCLLLGWFFARKLPDMIKETEDKPNILGGLVVAAILGLFCYWTLTRVPDWKDEMSLNTSAVKNSEGSCRAHCFYVTSLYKGPYTNSKDMAEKKALLDTMEYHITRSLQINPNYGAALVMKSAVEAGRFEQDHQLDKFFHQIEYIMEKIPYNSNFRDFLDQYMAYLNGSNSDKYTAFCHRAGYEFYYQKKKDPKTALHFLQFGLDRQTEDIRILTDMAEIYKSIGEDAKSAEMAARAKAQM
jgi:hypothetical protein